GMRQVGIIAAAGYYAVKHNITRLADDHANANLLAEGLNRLSTFEVDMSRVQTNIVIADTTGGNTAQSVLDRMKEVNLWAVAFGPKKIRMVTHLDVTTADCEEALERISTLFA
ncbi:MAG: beta-eliminating lyase-related protein, partial [candidate division Zixibacteria bacterium]|nr:beta-eliminating lyase-related protein [candidate division Zixibacteria bacterium]